jgi:hypothetical protein
MEEKKDIYDNVVYHSILAEKRIIDDYDEHSGQIEASHLESLGHYIVNKYEGEPSKVDFSWVDPEDKIILKLKDSARTVVINLDNLWASYFHENLNKQIDCFIISNLKGLDFVKLKFLKKFIDSNAHTFKSVNFVGINNKILQKYCSNLCSSYGVKSSFDALFTDSELENELENESGKRI